MTYLYVYRLTSDTGLAPCVDNGLLSLAVCKGGKMRGDKIIHTGLRHRIGVKRDADYEKDKVYILGTYENNVLYLARVTNVVTMTDYFSKMSKGRIDDIYDVVKGDLVRNKNLRKEDVHTEPTRRIKDFAGEFVILSDDFTYLGRDAVFSPLVDQYNARFQETKLYSGAIAEKIVKECKKLSDGGKHMPHKPYGKNGGCK